MSNKIWPAQQQPAMDASPQPNLVLIVEDEPPIAEALALIVEDAGYTTLTATHGREALELARTWHPALVFTDLMMPQLNGADLIIALRADAEAAGETPPPIVLMTAAGAAYTRETRADAVLRKPFDITEIEA
ncbi:MAG: response regulator transcription factor, partial [Ktedonobacterales bacterium]